MKNQKPKERNSVEKTNVVIKLITLLSKNLKTGDVKTAKIIKTKGIILQIISLQKKILLIFEYFEAKKILTTTTRISEISIPIKTEIGEYPIFNTINEIGKTIRFNRLNEIS